MSNLETGFVHKRQDRIVQEARRWFEQLVQPEQYVGEVYSISYETALVQIHDYYRQQVGGIPSLSFLIATRVTNFDDIDFKEEDSSIILLRVMDAAPLPNSTEAERIRVESAQRVSGEIGIHWDSTVTMDSQTHNILSFAGVQCRVIGTFFLDEPRPNPNGKLLLRFGSDISNYYPNRGLKVFKPNGKALEIIVNYQDPDRRNDLRNKNRVSIGEVRYASTNRSFQGITNVSVSISPADLLGQKSALFGMTRTGKSNTTKIIAKAVFDLRFAKKDPLRIGQIIFDPNGEYANENVQDANDEVNPTALKNVWKGSDGSGNPKDVVTYGVLPHPNDPNRKLMLINFFDDEMLQVGKEIINALLADDNSKYIQNFRQVKFEPPTKEKYGTDTEFYSERTRYRRRVLAYRTLLKKAGLDAPSYVSRETKGLFKAELLSAMENVELDSKSKKKENLIKTAAATFRKAQPSWSSLATAFEGLFYFLDTDEYARFNNEYVKGSSSGESWADADFVRILEMFAFTKGANIIGQVRNQHTNTTNSDFADDIYNDLVAGHLVIIDQSSGEPEVNNSSARRIMWKIFRKNQQIFREGGTPPDILVYIEEAHNLLPPGSEMDMKDVWVRTAKEGAKYHIGMVYVTQEISSIQKNILKNTANWFIGHLNNTDETKELRKFYDFADFEKSIIRAQDRGFLRVKTLSNLFVVPVQIKRFEV